MALWILEGKSLVKVPQEFPLHHSKRALFLVGTKAGWMWGGLTRSVRHGPVERNSLRIFVGVCDAKSVKAWSILPVNQVFIVSLRKRPILFVAS